MNICFVDFLLGGRNLLGFSGGADSSALFFLLMESGIEFDVAIVDYGIREASKQEVKYAQKLCERYGKKCFIHTADPINSNFEHNARNIRYAFFKGIIREFGYENLVLAHNLNDRLEWFLMQFSKGAGLNSILGFDGVSYDDGFRIVRPLFEISKPKILDYCKMSGIDYYQDSSNDDQKYKRNYFRHNYANSLIDSYEDGIRKSLEYLFEDKHRLYGCLDSYVLGDIVGIDMCEDYRNVYFLDKNIKKMGYLLSNSQKKEILKSKYSCILGDFVIIDNNGYRIFILPFSKSPNIILDTEFKDFARKNKVPIKLRKYVFLLLKNKIVTQTDIGKVFNFLI